MSTENKVLVYKKVPEGFPVAGEHLAVEKEQINLDQELQDGQVITKTLFLSLDPYMRGLMRSPDKKSYSAALEIDKPFYGYQVAEVVKSKSNAYPQGAVLSGVGKFKQYNVADENTLKTYRVKVLNDYGNLPLSNFTGALGMPGRTAYHGLKFIGKPKKGETLFISAASGAVGAMVGQLGKNWGLRVVGSAGSDDKVKYLLDELKFDAAFNYKTTSVVQGLKDTCPNGIDIYFENVGGETLEAVLDQANTHARVIVCGMISQYNTQEKYGIKNLFQLIAKRILMEGFLVGDFAEHDAEFYAEVLPLAKEGKIHIQEDVRSFDEAAEAFVGLLKGENFGKLVIKA